MDKFEQSELKGRKLFKSLLESQNIKDSQASTLKYDTADYYYRNRKGQQIGVEIKTRSIQYECYDTHFMELAKYNSLMKKIKDGEVVNAVYANFFGEDSAYLYPIGIIQRGLKDGSIKIVSRYCPVTTAINKGKMMKQVIEIPRSLAWRYEFKNNQWIKTN